MAKVWFIDVYEGTLNDEVGVAHFNGRFTIRNKGLNIQKLSYLPQHEFRRSEYDVGDSAF